MSRITTNRRCLRLREVLQAIARATAQRNATLLWNREDAGRLLTEMSTPGGQAVSKLHLPVNGDKLDPSCGLLNAHDHPVGHGFFTGHSVSEQAIFTNRPSRLRRSAGLRNCPPLRQCR